MFLEDLLVRTLQILLVPAIDPEVIWLLAPLIFSLILITMYFGRYRTEQLGWNTAFGNTVSLMWISVLLFKFLFERYGVEQTITIPGLRGQFLLVMGIAGLTSLLMLTNFFHLLPKRLAFMMSSAKPTYIHAYLTVSVVVGRVPVDRLTFIAGAVLFVFFTGMLWLYQVSITPPRKEVQKLEKHRKKQAKQMKKVMKAVKKTLGISARKKR